MVEISHQRTNTFLVCFGQKKKLAEEGTCRVTCSHFLRNSKKENISKCIHIEKKSLTRDTPTEFEGLKHETFRILVHMIIYLLPIHNVGLLEK